ncbi:uncharacterized protein LOC136031495 isoform X2 [Artemia franciscana]|uniref:uncharacterized protein LOC136031495 isoform X2 n=1 Tax=Artemia franciscana TaxID=6661 RepID=UPI0032DB7B4D
MALIFCPDPTVRSKGQSTMWALIIVILLYLNMSKASYRDNYIMKPNSHGCGRHPMTKVMSALKGHGITKKMSPNMILRLVGYDGKSINSLREMLFKYEDCIRTGDGIRFKRVQEK